MSNLGGNSNKPSTRVAQNPGGQSNWSLGWDEPEPKASTAKKYHNASNVVLGGPNEKEDEEEKKRLEEEKKKKQEELNKKLPGYDPKQGGKSTVHFGDDKTDYRKKDQVFTSTKVNNPPGGKSSIQFG